MGARALPGRTLRVGAPLPPLERSLRPQVGAARPDPASVGYLARGTLWILLGVGLGQAMGWLGGWIALRFVSPADYGVLVFLLAWSAAPVALASQGLPAAATRFVSHQVALGDAASARRTLARMRALVLAGGACMALLAPWLPAWLPRDVAGGLSPAAFALFFAAVVVAGPLFQLAQGAALGMKDARLRGVLGILGPTLLRAPLFAAILAFVPTLSGLLAAQALAFALAWALAEWLLRRHALAPGRARPEALGPLYRFAAPLAGAELLAFAIYQTDKVLLGYLGSAEDVAHYGVASRLAFAAIAPAWAAAQAIGPLFSECWSTGRIDALRKSYQRNARVFLVVTGALAALVIANARLLLWLFGPTFAASEPVRAAQILAVALLVGVLPGNQSQLYRMTGRTLISTLNSGLCAALCIALDAWWIPRAGLVGAALGTGVAIATANLTGFVFLRLCYGGQIHPFGAGYGRAVAAAAAMVATAFAAESAPLLANALVIALAGAAGWGVCAGELRVLAARVRHAT
jgi:O-antigen/teichoic acid export membrane protein